MEDFVKLHEPQFKSISLPSTLWPILYEKLKSFKSIEDIEDDLSQSFTVESNIKSPLFLNKNPNSHSLIRKGETLRKNSNIYVIPHIWGAEKLEDQFIKEQLVEHKDLQDHLWQLLNCEDFIIANKIGKKKFQIVKELESFFERGVVTFNESIPYLTLNNWELVPTIIHVENHIESKEIQNIFAHYYTQKYTWKEEKENVLVYVNLPNEAMKKNIKSTLTKSNWKLQFFNNEIFSGDLFSQVVCDESYWTIHRDEANQYSTFIMTLKKKNENESWKSIFMNEIKCKREECEVAVIPIEPLTNAANDKEIEEFEVKTLLQDYYIYLRNEKKRIALILHLLQTHYAQSYLTSKQEADGKFTSSNFWYLLNDYGCALNFIDSDNQQNLVNCRCVVFINILNSQSMSILWPIEDIKTGDELISLRTSLPWTH